MADEPFWIDWLPASLSEPIAVLSWAHWIGIGVGIFLGLLGHWLSKRLVHRQIKAWTDDIATVDADYEDQLSRPIALAFAGLIWSSILWLLSLPHPASAILNVAVTLILIVGSVWAAYRAVDLVHLVFGRYTDGELTSTQSVFVPMLEKTMRLFIVVFGVVLAADTFDVDVATLLAGLGIGGLAVALAAKDTLSNLFGSITILLDKPFELGDWVLVGDVEGVVEDIGFRTTKIRTFRNTQIVVPNMNLVSQEIENYGRREWRRYTTHLHLDPVTSAPQVEAFVDGMYTLIDQHPKTRKDYRVVRLHHVGQKSIEVLLYVFWKTDDWEQEMQERERLLLDSMRLAEELGIQFVDERARFTGGEKHWPKRPEREPDVDDDAYEAATHPLPADLDALVKKELVTLAAARGLDPEGTKAELIARLRSLPAPEYMTKWSFHAVEYAHQLAAQHGGPVPEQYGPQTLADDILDDEGSDLAMDAEGEGGDGGQ